MDNAEKNDTMPLTPQNFKILAVGDRVWGKGETIKEATKVMRKQGRTKEYVLFIIHPDSWVDDMGFVVYPKDYPPKEIDRVGSPKKKKLKEG